MSSYSNISVILFQIELLDNTGKFSVEPARANGHTAVSLKVNSQQLDYENPNERKFLLLVVASETNTEKKLSSTATVTVQVRLGSFWQLADQLTT